MFKNYLKTAFRTMWRYKGFAMINIVSLTIGIIGCLVIALFVFDEKKYDTFIHDADSIYRVYEQRNDNNTISYAAISPNALATFLNQSLIFPQASLNLRLLHWWHTSKESPESRVQGPKSGPG